MSAIRQAVANASRFLTIDPAVTNADRPLTNVPEVANAGQVLSNGQAIADTGQPLTNGPGLVAMIGQATDATRRIGPRALRMPIPDSVAGLGARE